MKKGMLVLGIKNGNPRDASHYITEVTEDKFTLRYGYGNDWSNPGEKAYTLVNTQDDFMFYDHTLKQKFRIDYCQAEALRALLKLEDEGLVRTFELYEKK